MKIKSVTISLLVASFFFMLSSLSFAELERKEKIVASVTSVYHPENRGADTVTLWMTIHTPSRFGGFQFIVVTDSRDRAKIRADFPAGSLHMLELPAETIKEFEAQIKVHVSVEKQLDTGIDPGMISQGFTVPSVKFSELPMRPVGFTVITEKTEDAPSNGG